MFQDARGLEKICLKNNVEALYLFGSRANGKTGDLSDYDFAALLEDHVSAKKYLDYQLALQAELTKIVGSDQVDVVVLNSPAASFLLRHNVISQGKVLFCKSKLKKIMWESKVLQQWLDWEYYEKLWGQIYVKSVSQGVL